MKEIIYALTALVCSICFYFTIIGVFEFSAACVSLVLFIALVASAWIFQRTDA